MGSLTEYIGRQFGNPHGPVGAICCLVMNVINRAMYRKTVSLVRVTKRQSVLDIGFGNGYLLKKLYQSTGAELYGIDISEDMVRSASRKNRTADKAGKLHLRVGDCCALPYEDACFDAVTSVNTVYFWSDTVEGLKEIRRTLKPGGSFYNAVYTREWLDRTNMARKGFKKFTPEELTKLGQSAGFSSIEVRQIVKNKSYVVIYKKEDADGPATWQN